MALRISESKDGKGLDLLGEKNVSQREIETQAGINNLVTSNYEASFVIEMKQGRIRPIPFEAYPAVPGYSIPPFGPLWVNKAPIGRQIGIAASLATKKVRPASEASKTSAWAIVAVTWDSGISLRAEASAKAKVLVRVIVAKATLR